MAIDLLQKFLGTGSARQDYNDFLQRFLSDPKGISNEEASRRYNELMSQVPPDIAAEAHEYAFKQLPPEARAQLAHEYQNAQQDSSQPFDGYHYDTLNQAATPASLGLMGQQAGQQDPGLLERMFGKDSFLNTPIGRIALAGVAAYIANRVLRSQGGDQASSSGPALPDLGELLGGGSRGQGGSQGPGLTDLLAALGALQGGQGNQGAGQAPDIADLLRQLAGQGASQGSQGPDIADLLRQFGGLSGGQGQGSQGGQGPDIGDLLRQLAGQGGGQGGQGPDIGDLLRQLAGQGSQQPPNTPEQPPNQGEVRGLNINPDAFNKKM